MIILFLCALMVAAMLADHLAARSVKWSKVRDIILVSLFGATAVSVLFWSMPV